MARFRRLGDAAATRRGRRRLPGKTGSGQSSPPVTPPALRRWPARCGAGCSFRRRRACPSPPPAPAPRPATLAGAACSRWRGIGWTISFFIFVKIPCMALTKGTPCPYRSGGSGIRRPHPFVSARKTPGKAAGQVRPAPGPSPPRGCAQAQSGARTAPPRNARRWARAG